MIGGMKMQITVCGICFVNSDDPSSPNYKDFDGGEPFKISVNGVETEVCVCGNCRMAMAHNLHKMLMAGGVAAEETGMLVFIENDDEDEAEEGDYEDEGEEGEEDYEDDGLWPEGFGTDIEDDDEPEKAGSNRTAANKAVGEGLKAVLSEAKKASARDIQEADNARIPEDDDDAFNVYPEGPIRDAMRNGNPFAEGVKNEVAAKRKPKAKGKAATNAEIRAWAKENGIPVGDRGNIKSEIREAYTKAKAHS
jgi:hypothetical protein